MADRYQVLWERVADAIRQASVAEAELGRRGFGELPTAMQQQLVVLQQQSEPRAAEPSLEELLGLEQNLSSYRRKLAGAIDIVRQMEAESVRRSRAHARASRRWVAAALAFSAVLIGVGLFAQYEHEQRASACAESSSCERQGACGAHLDWGELAFVCAATGPDDCARSRVCEDEGRCGWGPRESCIAVDDAACAKTTRCREAGACSVVEEACAPAADGDCKSSTACAEKGFCTVIEGRCQAGGDADCAASRACRETKACVEVAGKCVRPPDGFEASGASEAARGKP